jgi:cobalt-precorrin 5A hydrolase
VNAMTIALITLSEAGAKLLVPLVSALPGARLYLHESVQDEAIWTVSDGNASGRGESAERKSGGSGIILHESIRHEWGGEALNAERFTRIADLTTALFPLCRGLVYAAPAGVVVRAIAPLIRSKFEDPAVVVLDAGGRWAVSLLSGHEGGANDLAIRVANIIGAEPVITTTTEALKSVIVGIGCRRGTPAERIVAAVRRALAESGITLDEVRLIASADIKADEAGLLAAAAALGAPIRFIPAAEIRASSRDFSHSAFVDEKVNLPAVAEPAALLAGRRTRFICRKKTYNGITIALAREDF